MSKAIKNQTSILAKLGIEKLNAMQEEAQLAIHSTPETILLSPTGTGKTLAFLLPVIAELKPEDDGVQALILVPSRELAIQIEQVVREMGTGYKANAVYGGRSISKDKVDLQHLPTILIGTPGRIADHIRRETFSTKSVEVLILDEFDKSLEVGFEDEMSEIVGDLHNLNKKILTSATQQVEVPKFVGLRNPITVDHLDSGVPELKIEIVQSPNRDKLGTLVEMIENLGSQPGIVFCNFKDSIQRVSEYLTEHKIAHGCFHGSMEQNDRERALIKFRNGTHQLIVATDLAARGLDIPEMKFIIHYHLPIKSHEFTHRNGRTARMHSTGTAYVLQSVQEDLPGFITDLKCEIRPVSSLKQLDEVEPISWTTIFVSGGRKDKISKGDIAGFLFKQGKLRNDQLGIIELKQDCAFVAVQSSKVKQLIQFTDNTKLKKRKLRVKEI